MDAIMNIQVRIMAREAQAMLRSLQADIRRIQAMQRQVGGMNAAQSLNTTSAAAKGAAANLGLMARASRLLHGEMSVARRGLIAFGKDMQWIGRQLNFNFTLPLVAAAGFVGSWALANERAWTRVQKVYDDTSKQGVQDLEKLRRGMELLSEYYGVAQAEVIELAAEWAAAGATGADLARAVEANLRLGILGDYEDLNQAFKDLITIQSAFKLSTEQVATVVAELNTVENTTAAGMTDLTRAMALAGSTAAVAGVSHTELAAAIAALVPATGSASSAGNSLKTIYSRIMAPTSQMLELFEAMGIEFYDTTFQMQTGAERLQTIADVYDDLSDSQKSYVGSVAAGRRQLNRFLTLMEAMADRQSVYHQVMESLNPDNISENWERANQEIQTLLDSDPKRLDQVVNSIKNLAAEAILPLIPVLIGFLTILREAFVWFGNLDPEVQTLIFTIAGLVISIGVLSQAFGSVILLIGTMLRPIVWLGLAIEKTLIPIIMKAGAAIGSFLLGPWGIALGAAALLVWLFRDEVTSALSSMWDYIVAGFNALPQALRGALQAVINTIASAVRIVIEWLSWLNPFARHSPSLVDNVKAGVQVIMAEYSKLSRFGDIFSRQAKNLRDFANATASARAAAQASDRAETRSEILSVSPNAGPSLDALYADLDALGRKLNEVEADIDRQQRVTDQAKAAYDDAARAVDRFDASLDPLRDKVDTIADAIGAANDEIQRLANTPIQGMGAMSDAIFENEMAQKALRLEILKMEQAGQSYEDVQSKIALLNGEMETVRAKMAGLRNAGAGSEILSVYEDQLRALEAEKEGLIGQANLGEELQNELDSLALEGQILELERALEFDPLLREIDKLANGMEELPFDAIVEGIKEQQAALETLVPEHESLTAELESQEAILKEMIAQRDALRETYDAENEKLQALKDTYNEIRDAIREIEEAINAASQASATLTDGAGGSGGGGGAGGGGGFDDLAAGDFDGSDVPTFDMPDGLDDILAEWEQRSKELFSDPFKPLRDKWNEFVGWWNENVVGRAQGMWDKLGEVFSGLNIDLDMGFLEGIGESIAGFWETVADSRGGEMLIGWGEAIFGFWTMLEDDLGPIWDSVKGAFSDIGEGFASFGPVVQPFIQAVGRVGAVLFWLYDKQIRWTLFWLREMWGVITELVAPVIETIGERIKSFLEILSGLIGAVSSLINGDWAQAWEFFKQAIGAAFDWAYESFIAFPLEVLSILGEGFLNVIEDAWNWGWEIIAGLLAGLGEKFLDLITWIGELPGKIIDLVKNGFGISSPSTVFKQIGVDIIAGFLLGLINKAVDLARWVAALPGRVVGWVGEVGTKLLAKGALLLNGLWTGLKNKWTEMRSWVVNIPSRVVTAIGSVGRTLWHLGANLFVGLWNGMISKFNEVRTWVGNIGSRVVGAIGSLGSKLWNAGWDLMMGFKRGIERGWENVKGFLSALNPANYKGPPERDRVMLEENGRLIMAGLQKGMEQGWREVETTMQRMTNDLPNAFRDTQKYVMGEASMIGSGIGQAKIVHINGDLSFPNITDPGDAEQFISNIEVLAGDQT